MLVLSLIAIGVLALILALIPNVLWLLAWLIGLCFGAHVPYAPFGWTALTLAVAFLLTMSYGVWIGRFRLEVNQQEFRSEAVPESLDGFRIVHISDLHLSTFDDRPAALERIVEKINEQEPDIVCFTGDLVTMGVSEALPFADILKRIHTRYGVFSVLGNHDFLIYRRDLTSDSARLAEVEKLASFEREQLGWHLLRNANCAVKDGQLTVCGCDNSSCSNQGFHTIYAGDLRESIGCTEDFRLLLTHDPSHWREEVAGKEDIPLTLSGHTHAGQVRLFGWPLSSVSFKDNEGWYREGCNALYINRGLGCTMPMRLNCPAEITVITLRH